MVAGKLVFRSCGVSDMKLYIKELREQRGMTQKELAERMQVSFQTISKWENEVNLPDITHIPRLAEVFGVSSDVILGLEPMENQSELRQFDSTEYWNGKRQLVKLWKTLYWNEDYFEFLVRDVWKFDKPIDILDFGCGYGFLGQKFMTLLPVGSSYSGIELDEGQIGEAEEYFKNTSYPYEFIQADIYDYEPKKQYDLVVGMFLLSYVKQPENLIEKMKKSLKPGGMLLLIDANLEVEQAGYFSGLEKEEMGRECPDFVPIWEYELAHEERDYRMGTKLPYFMKQCGIQEIEARISDRVILYEPADEKKKDINQRFRYIYSHDDSCAEGVNYFLSRGANFQKANEYVEYFQQSAAYLNQKDAVAAKTSGIYFVYGKRQE